MLFRGKYPSVDSIKDLIMHYSNISHDRSQGKSCSCHAVSEQ